MKQFALICLLALTACSDSSSPNKKNPAQPNPKVAGYSCDQVRLKIAALGSPTTLTKIQAVFDEATAANPAFTTDLIDQCLGEVYQANCEDEVNCTITAK